MKISVIGLGKLGACMAASFARSGFEVTGVDTNPRTVSLLNDGCAPVVEPRLDAVLEAGRTRLRATQDYDEAIQGSDVSFMVVPTPSQADGSFALDYVLSAGESIGKALATKDTWHLIVLTSTVLPGSVELGLKRAVESSSGKRCGEDFGICYSPEFIALGSVITDFLNPDFILIGESDPRAGEQLETIYRRVCETDPPVARMSIVNAEVTKIALNTFLTTRITYANMLAELCERLPGGNVDVVTRALGMDTRIGAKYLKGGLGYGGPCFPRDNIAISRLLDGMGVSSDLPRTVDRTNQRQAQRVAQRALEGLGGGEGKVAVLGLSYKRDTPVVEASQGVEIAELLLDQGIQVSVYDPLAMDSARACLGERAEFSSSVADCVAGAKVVVVTTPWPQFQAVIEDASPEDSPVIIDAWRYLRPNAPGGAERYVGVGLGSDDDASRQRLEAFVKTILEGGGPV